MNQPRSLTTHCSEIPDLTHNTIIHHIESSEFIIKDTKNVQNISKLYEL